jgi:MoaA/NifB/PqqE/SkfB family radical SAM enzyme
MNIINKFFVFNKCLRYKFFKERIPLLVSLSVTGRCNLKCPYCYINASGRKPTESTLKTLCGYIDDFYSLGTRIFFLQGGEPLLRNDIVELASYIKAKGCYCSITTNGTIHKPIPELTMLDHLEFSLDGPPEVNDKTRGKGVFEKTVQAAKVAKKFGITFHFHTVLNVHNITEKDVKYVANLAKKFDTYMTACFATASGFENNQKFISAVSDKKIKKGYRMLIRLKKQGYPIYNSFHALNHALDWPISHNEIGFEDNLPSDYKMQCVHGRLAAWLDHEGWLYPCTLAFGREGFRENINRYGIKGAWKRLAKLKCKDCGIASDIPYLFGLKLENLLKIKKY